MKKLVVLMLVLGLCSVTNAAIKISVGGVVDPPDTQVILNESDNVIIDIHGLAPAQPSPGDTFFLGINVLNGEYGSLDISLATIPYPGNTTGISWLDNAAVAAMFGVENPFVIFDLMDLVTPPDIPKPLLGLLVDNIKFHCDGYNQIPTDVTLSVFDSSGTLLDTQVIHQIPEPITIALLGLGGLFLRRRK